nr:MAG TPA: hypothetical protein [Caudoviricetes sp.]
MQVGQWVQVDERCSAWRTGVKKPAFSGLRVTSQAMIP